MSKGKIIAMQPINRETGVKDKNDPAPESIDRYHAILKTDPLNQKAYSRLMILYRRLKDYKKELQVIESAIKAFESLYLTNKTTDQKVSRVSKQLNLAFGLTDKKGKILYEQEPVATWKKRRKAVLSRLHAS